jgi:tRNA G18 (ribose-2'-O)-methylase SpoU
MPDQPLDSLDDPRVEPYRELKRKASARTPARTFIAEGEKLVLRLLDSPCRTESILCTPSARARLPAQFADDVPVYIAPTSLISRLIGFPFHRGILACGVQPAERTIGALCDMAASRPQALVVLCPEIRDPENLGSIIRTALAFGAAGLVAGREGTDPFSRRVLRTSMGSVLQLPIVQTDDWPHVLDTLHAAGFESIATVLDPSGTMLGNIGRPLRAAVLLGNEDAGLAPELVARCRRRVILPMAAGVDSLNVAVASGIVLHHIAGIRIPDRGQDPPQPL